MVQIISDYGTFAFGRMGTINSDAGTFGFYSGAVNPFGTGWNALPGVGGSLFAAPAARMDNMITYKSPSFAGATVYAQYYTDADSTKGGFEENSNKFDRYTALGVNYANGGLNLAAVVDWVDEAKAGAKDPEDMYTINIGGSYNCGFAKTYLAAQYFKNANDFGGMKTMYNAAGVTDNGEVQTWSGVGEIKASVWLWVLMFLPLAVTSWPLLAILTVKTKLKVMHLTPRFIPCPLLTPIR